MLFPLIKDHLSFKTRGTKGVAIIREETDWKYL